MEIANLTGDDKEFLEEFIKCELLSFAESGL